MTGPDTEHVGKRDSATPGEDPDLAWKVSFLRRPEAYPDHPSAVDAIETHMAWVFLTDRHAYKLKKPVRSPVLDYGTAEKRRAMLWKELRLNSRLAPDVYLRVLPVTETADGSLALDGDGHPVDWLLKMRRLRADRTLSAGIIDGWLAAPDADRIADVLLDFYGRAETVEVAPEEYLKRLGRELDLGTGVLRRDPLGADAVRSVGLKLKACLDGPEGLTGARAAAGRLVDGHGDLRPEHVYLDGRPIVIDCLEFNRDLRTIDPVDELSYFAVECAMLGAGWFGDRVIEIYLARTRDPAPPELIRFYKGCRGFLRARLAVVHSERPGRHTVEHWHALAVRYLQLAERETATLG